MQSDKKIIITHILKTFSLVAGLQYVQRSMSTIALTYSAILNMYIIKDVNDALSDAYEILNMSLVLKMFV